MGLYGSTEGDVHECITWLWNSLTSIGGGEVTTESVFDILKVIWPVIALNYAMVIWAVVDLVRRENVKYMPKVLWGVIVLFVQIIGPVSYLVFGRGE